jgi:hypothetical protein
MYEIRNTTDSKMGNAVIDSASTLSELAVAWLAHYEASDYGPEEAVYVDGQPAGNELEAVFRAVLEDQ